MDDLPVFDLPVFDLWEREDQELEEAGTCMIYLQQLRHPIGIPIRAWVSNLRIYHEIVT
jgi:hypothetical protein